MELELKNHQIDCYMNVLHKVVGQEETQEAIVPDACPDILRNIEVCGQVCLRSKQAKEGVAVVTGTVEAAILYQPEEDSGVRRMEIRMPFEFQVDVPGLTTQGEVMAMPQLRNIEARILNPRKVLLRADLAMDVQCYEPEKRNICHAVAQGETECMQERQEERDAYFVACVKAKNFTFSEQIRLAGQGEVGEVLTMRGVPTCTESKLIGNKLVFKGNLSLQLLMRESSGGLVVAEHTLPFSQIMEIVGAGDTGDCEVDMALIKLDILPSAEGGKQLEVQVELLAQAVVRGHRRMELLLDTYSTKWDVDVTSEEHIIPSLLEASSRVQNVRELFELEDTVRKVVDCWGTMGDVRQNRTGEQIAISADVHLTLLYLDEGGSLQSVLKMVTAVTELDCPSHCICHCSCPCCDEVFATPSSGGAEIRVSVRFQYILLGQEHVNVVNQANLTELRQRGEGQGPSVVLRLPVYGEQLWDIAKSYGTTIAQIATANGLEEDENLPIRMLLIPSTRVN